MPNLTRRLVASIALMAVLAAPAATFGEASAWLPAPVAEGLADQLANRLGQLGDSPNLDELRAGAGRLVEALRVELDDRGLERVVAEAPSFAGFDLGSSGSEYLDAITRYQVCSAILMVQRQDPSTDPNGRIMATLGLTGLTSTVFFLRHPYIEAGGTQEAMEAHLTGSALEPVVQAIQSDAEARTAVTAACQPVVSDLLQTPVGAMQSGDS